MELMKLTVQQIPVLFTSFPTKTKDTRHKTQNKKSAGLCEATKCCHRVRAMEWNVGSPRQAAGRSGADLWKEIASTRGQWFHPRGTIRGKLWLYVVPARRQEELKGRKGNYLACTMGKYLPGLVFLRTSTKICHRGLARFENFYSMVQSPPDAVIDIWGVWAVRAAIGAGDGEKQQFWLVGVKLTLTGFVAGIPVGYCRPVAMDHGRS